MKTPEEKRLEAELRRIIGSVPIHTILDKEEQEELRGGTVKALMNIIKRKLKEKEKRDYEVVSKSHR